MQPGGGALGIAVAARVDVRELDASSTEHEFTEARALERRFDLAGNVAEWVRDFDGARRRSRYAPGACDPARGSPGG